MTANPDEILTFMGFEHLAGRDVPVEKDEFPIRIHFLRAMKDMPDLNNKSGQLLIIASVSTEYEHPLGQAEHAEMKVLLRLESTEFGTAMDAWKAAVDTAAQWR